MNFFITSGHDLDLPTNCLLSTRVLLFSHCVNTIIIVNRKNQRYYTIFPCEKSRLELGLSVLSLSGTVI